MIASCPKQDAMVFVATVRIDRAGRPSQNQQPISAVRAIIIDTTKSKKFTERAFLSVSSPRQAEKIMRDIKSAKRSRAIFIYGEVNCNLHKKLLQEKIPHEFYSRPGAHNWPYWFNAIKYQFLFFNDRFVRP